MNIFSEYYRDNYWSNDESVSGHGSTMAATQVVRRELPALLGELDVEVLLDIPCGDMNWMNPADLPVEYYIGADVVPALIADLRASHVHPQMEFQVLDITRDALPWADLILCRDLLGHFSSFDAQLALRNLKHSRAKYLLATTFPDHENLGDIKTGWWRPVNLEQFFGLPPAARLLNEGCTVAGFEDKSLGLWKLSGLR